MSLHSSSVQPKLMSACLMISFKSSILFSSSKTCSPADFILLGF
nr:MAG TPA: hypothetical protein [Caudoviricetes sp.]